MMIADQYRAHQRVLYENYLDFLKGKNVISQQLAFPLQYDLNVEESLFFEESKLYFFKIGFDLNIKNNKLFINALPSHLKENQLSEVIDRLLILRENIEKDLNSEEYFAQSLAKASAAKKGKKLSILEMEDLIQKLFQTSNPNYSPEGKPVFINFDLSFIEKQFSR